MEEDMGYMDKPLLPKIHPWEWKNCVIQASPLTSQNCIMCTIWNQREGNVHHWPRGMGQMWFVQINYVWPSEAAQYSGDWTCLRLVETAGSRCHS